ARVRLQQVLAAHARLARDARRHDDDVGAGGGIVAVRTEHAGVEAFDGRGLPLVQALPLPHTLHDVDHDDLAGELAAGETLSRGRTDVAGPHHRNLLNHVRG